MARTKQKVTCDYETFIQGAENFPLFSEKKPFFVLVFFLPRHWFELRFLTAYFPEATE